MECRHGCLRASRLLVPKCRSGPNKLTVPSGTIERFIEDPTTAPSLPSPPAAPPGAPIGLWPQDYLAGSEWIVEMGFGVSSNPWLDAFDLPGYWFPGR